jgi:hypothetical protein
VETQGSHLSANELLYFMLKAVELVKRVGTGGLSMGQPALYLSRHSWSLRGVGYAHARTGKNPSVPSVNPSKGGTVWNPSSTSEFHN